MDEDLILREIVKSLAFEIEAVNQDNVLKWSTTNGTPLNVKVRVRNKDEPRLVQRGTMPVPRIGISAPEKLALVSSNQTILSFSVYLQEELERKDEQKRQSGFKLFNIGSCLGTYSDDEGPYLPSSSNQNAAGSNNSITSSSTILQKKVSQVLSTSNTVPRSKKRFFGTCKPGGCLDPPFGEDNYSYGLAKTDRQENLRLELHELQDNKNTCEPGGCLDPHFSEEEYPYTLSKTEHQEKLGLISDETANNSIERRKKPSERSIEHEIFVQKTTKNEGDPKKLTDIYARTSVENSLKLKYSNSIITYPTDKRSKERISDQIPNKKISIKSNDDDSLRQSYEYPESYFVPPKDIIRYKEEERRHVRKLSTDQLSRSSKVAAHDTSDKMNLFKTLRQSEDIPQNIKDSKAKLTEKINLAELQPNDINITSESSEVIVNKSENAMLTQFSIKTENLQYEIDVVDFLVKQEVPLTQSTSRGTLNKIPPNKINNNKSENLDNGIHTAQMQVNENKHSARDTSRETINNLFSKESNNDTENLQNDIGAVERMIKQEISSLQHTSKESLNKLSSEKIDEDKTEYVEDSIHKAQMQVKVHNESGRDIQILDNKNAQTQDQDVVIRQPMQALEKIAATDIRTTANVNDEFKNDGDKIKDKILQSKTKVATAIMPVLATTATFDMTEKQSLQYKDTPNAITDSSMKEKNIDPLSYLEGHEQETNKHTFQKEPESVSPDYVSSTENSDFDISSAHSTDFIQELSSTGKLNGLLETSSQNDKRGSPANNDIKEKNEFSDIKLISETTEKKPSAILKKKPFITKHDSDVYNDDVNKATPLKRNTFTIIGSDTSLQKSEEIEVIPENITNAQFKTTDKTKLESLGKTRDNIHILDTLNINTKDKNHISSATNTAQTIKKDNLSVYSNITQTTKPNSVDQACIKEEGSDRNTTESENIFISDLDKKCIPENTYNVGTTNYQAETLDTTSKAIKYKQLPRNSNDDTSHSNVAKDGESTLDVQSPFKTELLDTKDLVVQITGDIPSQVTNNLDKDSSQKFLPHNVKHFDSKIKGENNFTDIHHQYEAVNKEAIALQNPEHYDIENSCTKITIDSKLVPDAPTSDKIVLLDEYNGLGLDSLQKPIPENNQEEYPTVYDLKTASSTRDPDKLEIAGIDDKENKNYINGKPFTETLQKPTTKTEKELSSGIAGDERNLVSIGHTSYEMYPLESNLKKNQNEMCDTLNIGSNQQRISENAHDLHTVITTGIKDGIFKERDNGTFEKSATDSIQKLQPENVQNMHVQVVDDIKDISFDQLYDKSKLVNKENNEPNEKLMTEHVEDLHALMIKYNELNNLKYNVSAKDDDLKVENEHNLYAQTADDNEHVSSDQINDSRTFLDTHSIDPKQRFMPKYVKESHLMMADKSNDEIERNNQMYNEIYHINYSESKKADLLQINSESKKADLLQIKSGSIQNLQAQTGSHIEYVSSSQMYHEKTALKNTENNIPAQNIIPEQVRGLHSIITDKINDETELFGQIYNELDKVTYDDLTTDKYSLNYAQTPDSDKYISSDQNYDKATILDPDSYEPPVKIYNSDIVDHDLYSRKYPEQAEVTQILTENIFGSKEKSRNASKNDSPFSGYSGLISEVLSNISENAEGEEKHTAPIEGGQGISSRLEDLAIPDTKVYRDHEMLDNEFANIVEEAGLIKLSHDKDSNYKIDNDSYKVPQNSLAKSFISTLEGSGENKQREKNVKSYGSTQFIAYSSDKLRHRHDENLTDAHIVKDDVLLDNTIDIANQNSEYQSSKILGSLNDSIIIDKVDFSLRQQQEQHLAEQKDGKTIEREYQSHSSVYISKLDGSETTSLKKDPVYVDMSFYSYMNDNNQRVLQTHSPVIERGSHAATVTVVKTLIRHGNEIRIPVDRENDISLNILDKDVPITNKVRTTESSMRHTRREKHVVDRAKGHELLNKNLALIYEHELMPLHNVIKDLTQEVNTLSAQQEKIQMKIRNAKRTKSLRLIPVVKRCGCRRIQS